VAALRREKAELAAARDGLAKQLSAVGAAVAGARSAFDGPLALLDDASSQAASRAA
jgi:hypothetical protein